MHEPPIIPCERQGDGMLIYDAFGRHIGVQRRGERWLLFRVDLNEREPVRRCVGSSSRTISRRRKFPAGWAIFFTKRQARAILTSGLWSSVYGQLLFCSTTR